MNSNYFRFYTVIKLNYKMITFNSFELEVICYSKCYTSCLADCLVRHLFVNNKTYLISLIMHVIVTYMQFENIFLKITLPPLELHVSASELLQFAKCLHRHKRVLSVSGCGTTFKMSRVTGLD